MVQEFNAYTEKNKTCECERFDILSEYSSYTHDELITVMERSIQVQN